jgi:hypothetical protein
MDWSGPSASAGIFATETFGMSALSMSAILFGDRQAIAPNLQGSKDNQARTSNADDSRLHY